MKNSKKKKKTSNVVRRYLVREYRVQSSESIWLQMMHVPDTILANGIARCVLCALLPMNNELTDFISMFLMLLLYSC